MLDYCKGNLAKQQNIRAVIRDKTLHASRQATVYGSSSDNSTVSTFKRIGYIISIFFLFLTLAIYLVIKEVRAVSTILITQPLSREHFSLKIDVRDQTIWNCILEL